MVGQGGFKNGTYIWNIVFPVEETGVSEVCNYIDEENRLRKCI